MTTPNSKASRGVLAATPVRNLRSTNRNRTRAAMNAVLKSAETVESDPRWDAIRTRDARADGTFYYSVKTTGVYCRPACGSRLPRPENIAFHSTRADAERAGFRPCKRCKPDQPSLAETNAANITE